ncbi:MAG TPA: cytochrome c oxidase assembly protein [Rhodanobacteraceae bacterium]|nr:cytochrome c oxidase assembly protein [Rhodanobacteraceae bacterium]
MSQILMDWSFEPWLLACVAAAAVPYALGMHRMGAQRGVILGRWRAASFFGGLFVLLLALVSPLDAVADDLFSAHMFQHMLLLLVIPPLLVYGRPVITWLWAFDLDARRSVVRGWKRTGLDATFRGLMHPLVVWVLLTMALCFWHLPGPYDAAVRNEWLHDLEHLSFLVVSLQFWTLVIEPYGQRRALGYGATVVFVVSAGFVMGMIGAVLTFAPAPLYGAYLHATQAYGLTPLDDQQLAGIIMWIPSNLVHAGALCTVFFAWFRADERRATRTFRSVPHVLPMLLVAVPLLALMLSGCAGNDAQDRSHDVAVRRGAQLISKYGCGSCHTIPGINGADGLVGPPLAHWSRRTYIAGVLPNDPDNLQFWIQHPQQVVPGVDMPDMDIRQQEARDIAIYLDTIR